MRLRKENPVISHGWRLVRLSVIMTGIVVFSTANQISLLQADETKTPTVSGRQSIRAQIGTLPYLHGYKPAPQASGIIVHDQELAQPGLNLCVSGGSPPVVLMDMAGTVLHAWSVDPNKLGLKNPTVRRARLFGNGDILMILERTGLLKLDKNSRPIWFFRGQVHHDCDVAENGDIYVLTGRNAQVNLEDMDITGSIFEDCITILSPEGKEQKVISIFEAFKNSDHRSVLQRMLIDDFKGDVFHTNSLELIDGSLAGKFPPFRKGCALISLRNLQTIAVVDLDEAKVTWALSGMWSHQHQPTILSNGNILLFDNLGEKGNSKVIEFNPCTQTIFWAYRGNDENGFRSEDLGSQQRLPNGNTLITESRDGRAFEVTPDNKIVWEFINPQRHEESLIAAIYEMIRLNPDDLAFLDKNNR